VGLVEPPNVCLYKDNEIVEILNLFKIAYVLMCLCHTLPCKVSDMRKRIKLFQLVT
jgi:hypothetical protein